jgi:hypothetical protein
MHDAWRPGTRRIDLDFNDDKKFPTLPETVLVRQIHVLRQGYL